mmetsp:Transcript_106951/g.168875  ORF Transcript_106951/g.168875 Transcript_106951/m.168875 type:complete len:286 (+) Transcript_106951:43-900(+)
MVKVTKLKPKPRKILLPFGKLGRKGRRSSRREGTRLLAKPQVETAPKEIDVGESVVTLPNSETSPAIPVGRSILKQLFSFRKAQERNEEEKKVNFCPIVKVHQFSLRAGGSDCVPQDGSNLAIGLGELLRTTSHPLCPKKKASNNCIEGPSFITVAQRKRLLAASEARCSAKELAAHRAELDEVQRSRALVNMDSCNFRPMTSSLPKAQERAMKLYQMLQKGNLKKPLVEDAAQACSAASPRKRPAAAACVTQTSPLPKSRIPTSEEFIGSTGLAHASTKVRRKK